MNYKLGKRPAVHDARTLRLRDVYQDLPSIPPEYNFDASWPGLDIPMFLNDQFGCCVVAAKAHHTLGLELVEQRAVIDIPDSDVKTDYFAQTRGDDVGLNMLAAMVYWRKNGWTVNGKQYGISAFGSVDTQDLNDLIATIFLLRGTHLGLAMPDCWQDQYEAGEPWDVHDGPSGVPNPDNGHAVLATHYSCHNEMVWVKTWGGMQAITFRALKQWSDEAYGVVDSVDPWLSKSGLNVGKMQEWLAKIRA